jgi:hypothetical protein
VGDNTSFIDSVIVSEYIPGPWKDTFTFMLEALPGYEITGVTAASQASFTCNIQCCGIQCENSLFSGLSLDGVQVAATSYFSFGFPHGGGTSGLFTAPFETADASISLEPSTGGEFYVRYTFSTVPVPEPATLLLLFSGLMGVFVRRVHG